MNNIKVGSKWKALVDKPLGAGVLKGAVVTVERVFPHGNIDYSEDGPSDLVWYCGTSSWYDHFEPYVGQELDRSDYPKIDDTGNIVDNVNGPSHYGQGKIEAIEYIKDSLTREEYVGYLRGNIAKYLHRWRYKNGLEDLKKAQVYLGWLVQEVE